MERRHKHEEHENDERWLITYADLITLLMVFFVVMWSISRADAAKFAAVAQSISVAFGAPKGSIVPTPSASSAKSSKKAPKTSAASDQRQRGSTQTKLQSVAKKIEELIKEKGLQDMIALDGSADGRKLTIRLRDSVLFDRGGAELTPEAQDLIDRLGSVLKDIGMTVNVAGHTDDLPIRSGDYKSNLELSTARSTAVIDHLITHDAFPAELLPASGYGEHRPLVPNDSPEHRAKNRRVEFVITDDGPIDLADAKTVTAPSASTTEEPATVAEEHVPTPAPID